MARNLKLLMRANPRLDTLKKIVEATDGRLSNGKLDRVRRAASATDVDTLEELAVAFKVEPWQMFVETLAVESDSSGKVALAGLPDWPFAMVDRSRYMALPEALKGFVEARVIQAIEECEKRAAKSKVLHTAINRTPVTDAHVERHLPPLPPGAAEEAARSAARGKKLLKVHPPVNRSQERKKG